MQPKRSSAPFDAASFDGHASGAAHWWKESFQLKLPLMVSVMGTASFQTQFPVFQFLYHLYHKLSLIIMIYQGFQSFGGALCFQQSP